MTRRSIAINQALKHAKDSELVQWVRKNKLEAIFERFNALFCMRSGSNKTKCPFPTTAPTQQEGKILYRDRLEKGSFFHHFTLGRPVSDYQFRRLVQFR